MIRTHMISFDVLSRLILGAVLYGWPTLVVGTPAVHVVAEEANDLYVYLSGQHGNCLRYDAATDLNWTAVADGDAVLLLADGYPTNKTPVPTGFFTDASTRNAKVLVEFPERIPSESTGGITTTTKERCVVDDTSLFGGSLSTNDILDAGRFSYVAVTESSSAIRAAKVAGFDSAVYGLAGTASVPLLFTDGDVLVCTTKISDYRKSRYAPMDSWGAALGSVLSDLGVVSNGTQLAWTPKVRASYGVDDPLPANVYTQAVLTASDWYEKGRFLIHPDWESTWSAYNQSSPPVGPPMDLSLPSGDGSLGVMEGHFSVLYPDGSQQYRYWLRADCVSETAMTLAMANALSPDPDKLQVATNLLAFLFDTDTFKTSGSRDPDKTAYGLIGWAGTDKGIYYGDDNARVILGAVLAAQAVGSHQWDDDIVRLILANFRTTGLYGFRGRRLVDNTINATTWQILSRGTLINAHPHFESWLWATYLWLYGQSGRQDLLQKARTGITETMTRYSNDWRWTNGLQQERARMILPLAWLVRVDDTQQHRDWLDQVVTDFLADQVACGAITEELGPSGKGDYPPPSANSLYGTTEAPVIQENGDPVSDMLYTVNFGFFALNEAARATGDASYIAGADKLAEFLVRIQSTSEDRADLDGTWLRAFDYNRWEYFGSDSDHGWGALGTLTGWMQSFMTTTLALRLETTSFWERTQDSGIAANFETLWEEMLPQTSPLYALYRFEDASGTNGSTIVDSSPASHDGTVTGGDIDLVSGNAGFGNAARFSGEGGLVEADVSSVGTELSDFTIAFWMKADDLDGSQLYITARYYGSAGQFAVIFEYAPDQVELFSNSSGPNPRTGSQITIPDIGWHHIVYTRNGTDYDLYLDGVKTDIGTLSGAFSSVADVLTVGGISAGKFKGQLDDVAWFDAGVDQAGVDAMMSGDFSPWGGPSSAGAVGTGTLILLR